MVFSTQDTYTVNSVSDGSMYAVWTDELGTTDWKIEGQGKVASYPEFHKTALFIFAEIYGCFCCVIPWVAIVCNSISISVFATKSAKNQTVNILLIALAISDTFSLLVSMDFGIFFVSDYKYSLMQQTDFFCKAIKYVESVARVCSAYFVLAFTVDRYIEICVGDQDTGFHSFGLYCGSRRWLRVIYTPLSCASSRH